MNAKPIISVTVSDDGSVTRVGIRDRKGQTINLDLGIEAIDDVAIALMRASQLAHQRSREMAHKSAREKPASLQS